MPRKWVSKAGWFIFIWVASVALLVLVAFAIRLVIVP